MITKLTLRNFKSIREQTYNFTHFDLLVGTNNSGKSTLLQALAIWQFCIDEFGRAKRRGKRGVQIVLPNFTALPVPVFNLLWRERTDYVPPFSGLEDREERRDDGPLRKQVGKAQPGSVLRNLLLRVWDKDEQGWRDIQEIVKKWFSVELISPKYLAGVDTQITCEYKQGGKAYDIIAGGSGFHQTLTLLAFLYGYHPTTILLDEPDAHLHVNLQRNVLDYFRFFNSKAQEKNIQFLISTHAEEFIRGVEVNQIISLLSGEPRRIKSTPEILIK